MRALVPASPTTVAFADVAEPSPAAGEAVVEVAAFSVNRGETFVLEQPRSGWRPGKDAAGTVVQAAADGSGPPVGARVVAHPAAAGWAERVAVTTDALAALPKNVPFPTAAALPLAGITATRLLRAIGPLPGVRILVTGASGGVGHYLAELASAGGAQVTAVSRTPERGRRLAELGAAVVAAPPSNGGFDVVLESVGGTSFDAARQALRPGGRLVWFGQASRIPVQLDFFDLLTTTPAISIEQFDYTDGGAFGPELETLVRLVAAGHLHPEIDSVRPWTATNDALTALRDRRIRGNAVLTVGGEQ